GFQEPGFAQAVQRDGGQRLTELVLRWAGRGGGGKLVVQVPGQHRGRGVVEDQGRLELKAGGGLQSVPQLDGGQRVEAQIGEGPVRGDQRGAGVAEDRSGVPADQVGQQLNLIGYGQQGQPLAQRPGLVR